MSNSDSPPAEPGVYLKEIIIKSSAESRGGSIFPLHFGDSLFCIKASLLLGITVSGEFAQEYSPFF
jgi:hypothetical protein